MSGCVSDRCFAADSREIGVLPGTGLEWCLPHGRAEVLEKARDEIEKVHDLASQATRQRREDIFSLLPLARQGR